jgi:hypothetical protein
LSIERDHGRIVAVDLLQLQRQAFLEIAREYAGGVALLKLDENRLDMGGRGAECLGHRCDVGAQVTSLVQRTDEMLADQPLGGGFDREMKLVGQVLGKRRQPGQRRGEIHVLGIERKTAA